MEIVAVKSNEFEKLLEKIKSERETEKHSELNMARRLKILKTISSVYFFLRVALEMPYRAISLEEFEIAEAKLRSIAQENTERPWCRFWNALGLETWWGYYLRFGYFEDRFKSMEIFVWPGYSFTYWLNHSGIDYIFSNINAMDKNLLPPNLRALLEEIFAKKYGAQQAIDKK